MCSGASAADFVTGQAARLLIGQPTFTYQDIDPSNVVLGAASGLAYANNMLFVADANRVGAVPLNNRLLIFKDIVHQLPQPTDVIKQGSRCNVCVGVAAVVEGQADFSSTDPNLTQSGLRTPTSVATDGKVMVVADTDNNRVLIWNNIPTSNNVPADVVVGQADFTHSLTAIPPTSKSMRGPQGVWIQNGKLYVADTQDNRVLVYNQIPTSNGAAADLVLGAKDFTTYVQVDITQQTTTAQAANMLNPVSVTSDGTHLFVTDLGYHRVLIWNTIPTANGAPADVAVGQPNLTSSFPNNAFTTDSNGVETPVLCTTSNGTDTNSHPTYPARCASTLSFPRYTLSDGTRLFIADGGNDRVLVFSKIPTTSGASADAVLGQPDATIDGSGVGANSLITPMSLAWDGTNLFVSDTYNLRILVFTPAQPNVPLTGIRNAASREVFAVGSVTLGGTITTGDKVTVTIGGKDYAYTIVAKDTFTTILTALVNLINGNGGDANVIANSNPIIQQLLLTAKAADVAGNSVTLATTVSSGATINANPSGATLLGGQNSAQLAPGTIISIFGQKLAANTVIAPDSLNLPTDLAGVQVYLDGIRIPLFFVSPSQINAQIPYEVTGSTGVSIYVRSVGSDGAVTVTSAVGVPIVEENPGIFAQEGTDPRPAVMVHGSAYATGLISVDGSIKAGEVGTVTINGRAYAYTILSTDTLYTVRDALITLINASDPQVRAFAAGSFTRIRLHAKAGGSAGIGIPFSAAVTGTNLLLTAIGYNNALCCPNQGPVTPDNPARPGEVVTIYGAGLGLLQYPANKTPATGIVTGQKFGGGLWDPVAFVSSLAGGKTANVLLANLAPGMVGVYQVDLQLDTGLGTNPLTQLTIGQGFFTSNAVTFPLHAPPLVITSVTALPTGTQNVAYSFTFVATGGASPYTWTITAGSAPAGLTLSTAGVLSGTPTSAAASSFTVKVTDTAGTTATQTVSLTINPAVTTTSAQFAPRVRRRQSR